MTPCDAPADYSTAAEVAGGKGATAPVAGLPVGAAAAVVDVASVVDAEVASG